MTLVGVVCLIIGGIFSGFAISEQDCDKLVGTAIAFFLICGGILVWIDDYRDSRECVFVETEIDTLIKADGTKDFINYYIFEDADGNTYRIREDDKSKVYTNDSDFTDLVVGEEYEVYINR